MKFTKFPWAKSKEVPTALAPNTLPKAPSYIKRKKAEIIKFGSSLRGRLTTLRSNLFVNIPNWVKNGAW